MPADPSPPSASARGWGAHVPAVLAGLALLLGVQLAGTVLVDLTGLPVPGAVVGLAALLALGPGGGVWSRGPNRRVRRC